MSQQSQRATVPERPQVVIGLATYRRPDDLERILPGLVAQAAELDPPATIVVVDNDPEAGAREQVPSREGLVYVHEPKPGIAAARNAALAAARAVDFSANSDRAGADVIVFVDDDEEVTDGWLTTLVDCWRRYGSAAVAGPVTTVFDDDEVEDYVRHCGVFDRIERPTGMLCKGAATNNLLLDLRWLEDHDLSFDNAFGLTGGSDGLLTRTIVRLGGEIRWCNEADVLDHIPASRSTRTWVNNRVARQANSWARVLLVHSDGRAAKAYRRGWLLAHAAVMAGRGAAGHVAARRAGDEIALAKADMSLSRAKGCAQGALGGVRFDYKRAN